jgi:hypothetical protein
LDKKVKGMESEEDMIKQRAEIRGLIEKKTYIGLVSCFVLIRDECKLTCTDPSVRGIDEACSSRRDWSVLL